MTNQEANQTRKEAYINLHKSQVDFWTWSSLAQTNPNELTTNRLDEAKVELRTATHTYNQIKAGGSINEKEYQELMESYTYMTKADALRLDNNYWSDLLTIRQRIDIWERIHGDESDWTSGE